MTAMAKDISEMITCSEEVVLKMNLFLVIDLFWDLPQSFPRLVCFGDRLTDRGLCAGDCGSVGHWTRNPANVQGGYELNAVQRYV